MSEIREFLRAAIRHMESPMPEFDPATSDAREALAAYAHEAWSGWMRYLFSKCEPDLLSAGAVIPRREVERWRRQMATPYASSFATALTPSRAISI